MAISISKQRLYRKYANFSKAYRIIHLETSSDIVMRGDTGISVEDTLRDYEDRIAFLEHWVKLLRSCFYDNGVLRPECGGTGFGSGNPLWDGEGDWDWPDNPNPPTKPDPGEEDPGLTRDDLINVGDPETGDTFQVTLEELAEFLLRNTEIRRYIRSKTINTIEKMAGTPGLTFSIRPEYVAKLKKTQTVMIADPETNYYKNVTLEELINFIANTIVLNQHIYSRSIAQMEYNTAGGNAAMDNYSLELYPTNLLGTHRLMIGSAVNGVGRYIPLKELVDFIATFLELENYIYSNTIDSMEFTAY